MNNNCWSILLIILLNLIVVLPVSSQEHPNIVQLKDSIRLADKKTSGKFLFHLSKQYLEIEPNIDSFKHYMALLRKASILQDDKDLLFNYYYYSGIRYYRLSEYPVAKMYMDSATVVSNEVNDSVNIAKMYYAKAVLHNQMQEHKAFYDNLIIALDYAGAIKQRSLQASILVALSIESSHQGLLEKQFDQLEEAYTYFEEVSPRTKINIVNNLALVHLKKYDENKELPHLTKAKSYIDQGLAVARKSNNKTALVKLLVKKIFWVDLSKGKTHKDFLLLADSITSLGILLDDPFYIHKGLSNKAIALNEMGRPLEALKLKDELLKISEILLDPIIQRTSYKTLYNAAVDAGRYKEAIHYNESFLAFHDSITSIEKATEYADVLEKYENEKKSNEIQRLSHEKTTLKQEAQIQSIKSQKRLLNMGLVLLLCGLIGLWYFFKQRQKLNQAKLLASSTEQRLLRSQMNPHFLFNSLNSIKRFYIDGRTEEANDFLADFSSLLRQILEQSSKSTVQVEEELNFLSLYLDLEKRRLKKNLSFEISYNKEDFDYDDNIPSLILQPLVENSIWHGIMKSKRDGKIHISVVKEGEKIRCTVLDNGVGYHSLANNKSEGYVSRGLQLIKDRLNGKGVFSIDSIKDERGQLIGTKAEIILSV